MPRQRSAQPAYQFHLSGQARVTLAGQDFYLGKHGTPESYARYYALLAEYNANGKQPPAQPKRLAEVSIRIRDITADFRHRVIPRYEHDNGQHNRLTNLCDLLDQKHGDESPDEFGPRKLEALRDQFLADGVCRKYANCKARLVVRIIKHGVSRELVSADRIAALESLEPLKIGQGREGARRTGVSVGDIERTLPHLSAVLQAMVRVQLATAMRPSELFRMTPAMIDRSGTTWFYRPEKHKTAGKGVVKAVPILEDARAALTPYLFGDADQLCFKTGIGTPWNKDSYRIAITRAAKTAKVTRWTPYAIRHTTAQSVRDAVGPEFVQSLLGHTHISTSEIYAKTNELKSAEAAKHAPKLSVKTG
jgi:integrase